MAAASSTGHMDESEEGLGVGFHGGVIGTAPWRGGGGGSTGWAGSHNTFGDTGFGDDLPRVSSNIVHGKDDDTKPGDKGSLLPDLPPYDFSSISVKSAGPYESDRGRSIQGRQLGTQQYPQGKISEKFALDNHQYEARRRTPVKLQCCPVGGELAHIIHPSMMVFSVAGDEKAVPSGHTTMQAPSTKITAVWNGLPKGTQLIFQGIAAGLHAKGAFRNQALAVYVAGLVTVINTGPCWFHCGMTVAFHQRPMFTETSTPDIDSPFGESTIKPRFTEAGLPNDMFRPSIYPLTHTERGTLQAALTETVRVSVASHGKSVVTEPDNVYAKTKAVVDAWLREQHYPDYHCAHMIGYWLTIQQIMQANTVNIVYLASRGSGHIEYRTTVWPLFVKVVNDILKRRSEAYQTPATTIYESEMPPTSAMIMAHWNKATNYVFDQVLLACTDYSTFLASCVIGRAMKTAGPGEDLDMLLGNLRA